jgi:hypothetical protein
MTARERFDQISTEWQGDFGDWITEWKLSTPLRRINYARDNSLTKTQPIRTLSDVVRQQLVQNQEQNDYNEEQQQHVLQQATDILVRHNVPAVKMDSPLIVELNVLLLLEKTLKTIATMEEKEDENQQQQHQVSSSSIRPNPQWVRHVVDTAEWMVQKSNQVAIARLIRNRIQSVLKQTISRRQLLMELESRPTTETLPLLLSAKQALSQWIASEMETIDDVTHLVRVQQMVLDPRSIIQQLRLLQNGPGMYRPWCADFFAARLPLAAATSCESSTSFASSSVPLFAWYAEQSQRQRRLNFISDWTIMPSNRGPRPLTAFLSQLTKLFLVDICLDTIQWRELFQAPLSPAASSSSSRGAEQQQRSNNNRVLTHLSVINTYIRSRDDGPAIKPRLPGFEQWSVLVDSLPPTLTHLHLSGCVHWCKSHMDVLQQRCHNSLTSLKLVHLRTLALAKATRIDSILSRKTTSLTMWNRPLIGGAAASGSPRATRQSFPWTRINFETAFPQLETLVLQWDPQAPLVGQFEVGVLERFLENHPKLCHLDISNVHGQWALRSADYLLNPSMIPTKQEFVQSSGGGFFCSDTTLEKMAKHCPLLQTVILRGNGTMKVSRDVHGKRDYFVLMDAVRNLKFLRVLALGDLEPTGELDTTVWYEMATRHIKQAVPVALRGGQQQQSDEQEQKKPQSSVISDDLRTATGANSLIHPLIICSLGPHPAGTQVRERILTNRREFAKTHVFWRAPWRFQFHQDGGDKVFRVAAADPTTVRSEIAEIELPRTVNTAHQLLELDVHEEILMDWIGIQSQQAQLHPRQQPRTRLADLPSFKLTCATNLPVPSSTFIWATAGERESSLSPSSSSSTTAVAGGLHVRVFGTFPPSFVASSSSSTSQTTTTLLLSCRRQLPV